MAEGKIYFLWGLFNFSFSQKKTSLKYRVSFPTSYLSLGDMYIASQTSKSNTKTDTYTHAGRKNNNLYRKM